MSTQPTHPTHSFGFDDEPPAPAPGKHATASPATQPTDFDPFADLLGGGAEAAPAHAPAKVILRRSRRPRHSAAAAGDDGRVCSGHFSRRSTSAYVLFMSIQCCPAALRCAAAKAKSPAVAQPPKDPFADLL